MFKQAILFTVLATITSYNCSAMDNPAFFPNEEVIIETKDGGYDHGIIKGFCKKLHCTHAVNGVDSKPICEYVDQDDYDCDELECFEDSSGQIACQNCHNRKVKRFYIVYDVDKGFEVCLPEHLLHSLRASIDALSSSPLDRCSIR